MSLSELMNNAASACYNFGAPQPIAMLKDYYSLDRDFYNWTFSWYFELLDYGSAFANESICGQKVYEIECENDWLDSDVIRIDWKGNLIFDPYYMQTYETVSAKCTISAYFADYNPKNFEAAMPWASQTF